MDNRDMYYNGTYGGYTPFNNMPNGIGGIPFQNQYDMNNGLNSQMPNNNYTNNYFNDINERLNRLERQIKRIEQRLTRLETPYANTTNYNQDIDNNMYMM